MFVVKTMHPRVLSDDEFNGLKNTPAWSVLMNNRVRVLCPPPEANGNSNLQQFQRSIRDWLVEQCSDYVYMKLILNNTHLDLYFRSKTEAAGFKLAWHDRMWGD